MPPMAILRSWESGGGEGEHVDLGAQGLDGLFLLDAEAVFLVDDQQAQVGELELAPAAACVPTRISVLPAATRRMTSASSFADLKRETTSMLTSQSAKRSLKELKCCCASKVVGTSTATCLLLRVGGEEGRAHRQPRSCRSRRRRRPGDPLPGALHVRRDDRVDGRLLVGGFERKGGGKLR